MNMDHSLLDAFERLNCSLVSDAAEAAGLGTRALPPGAVPFHSDRERVVAGYAFPCQVERTDERVEIDALLAMVDAVPAHSFVVLAADEEVNAALWGGLMTTRSMARGARGAAADGGVRDLQHIESTGFPVFARYACPLDIRGRAAVTGFGEHVEWQGLAVDPGDVVVADVNGIVVIPRPAAQAVLAICTERLEREAATEAALRAGISAVRVYGELRAF